MGVAHLAAVEAPQALSTEYEGALTKTTEQFKANSVLKWYCPNKSPAKKTLAPSLML